MLTWTLRKEFELYDFCKQRLDKQLRLIKKLASREKGEKNKVLVVSKKRKA